jgi:hypothetical protein
LQDAREWAREKFRNTDEWRRAYTLDIHSVEPQIAHHRRLFKAMLVDAALQNLHVPEEDRKPETDIILPLLIKLSEAYGDETGGPTDRVPLPQSKMKASNLKDIGAYLVDRLESTGVGVAKEPGAGPNIHAAFMHTDGGITDFIQQLILQDEVNRKCGQPVIYDDILQNIIDGEHFMWYHLRRISMMIRNPE